MCEPTWTVKQTFRFFERTPSDTNFKSSRWIRVSFTKLFILENVNIGKLPKEQRQELSQGSRRALTVGNMESSRSSPETSLLSLKQTSDITWLNTCASYYVDLKGTRFWRNLLSHTGFILKIFSVAFTSRNTEFMFRLLIVSIKVIYFHSRAPSRMNYPKKGSCRLLLSNVWLRHRMLKSVGIQAYSQAVALYSDLGQVQQWGTAQLVLILLISPHCDWTLLCEGSLTMMGGDFVPFLELRRSEGGWARQHNHGCPSYSVIFSATKAASGEWENRRNNCTIRSICFFNQGVDTVSFLHFPVFSVSWVE